MGKLEWLCIDCSALLGRVIGGELHPAIPGEMIRTNGPNLVLTCPECGRVKVWYTADPVVRAVYQLTDAVASAAARAMIDQIGGQLHRK